MKDILIKKKDWLFVSGYAVLIISLVYFVVLPSRNEVRQVSGDNEKIRIDQDARQRKLAELSKTKEQFVYAKEVQDEIDVLLSQDDAVELIEHLEGMAEGVGASIAIQIAENKGADSKAKAKQAVDSSDDKSKDTKTKAKEKTLQESLPSQDYLQLIVSLEGSYDEIIHFVQRLENAEYLSDVLSVQITAPEKAENGDSAAAAAIRSIIPAGDANSEALRILEGEASDREAGVSALLNVAFYLKK